MRTLQPMWTEILVDRRYIKVKDITMSSLARDLPSVLNCYQSYRSLKPCPEPFIHVSACREIHSVLSSYCPHIHNFGKGSVSSTYLNIGHSSAIPQIFWSIGLPSQVDCNIRSRRLGRIALVISQRYEAGSDCLTRTDTLGYKIRF